MSELSLSFRLPEFRTLLTINSQSHKTKSYTYENYIIIGVGLQNNPNYMGIKIKR